MIAIATLTVLIVGLIAVPTCFLYLRKSVRQVDQGLTAMTLTLDTIVSLLEKLTAKL